MKKIRITNSISLNESELQEKFVRSSGPGGQNVNKVSSAVQLRFDVLKSPNLPQHVRAKLLGSGDQRLTNDGVLVITAENHRTQEANRKEALDRLKSIISKAAYVQKKRLPTKPSRSAKRKRVDSKVKRGKLKQLRSSRRDLE